MRLIICTALCLATYMFCHSSVAASLLLPNNANTVLVNGVATEQQQVKLDINTPQGLQQIAFRYHARFRDQGSQHSFSSDVIILRFSASDQDYQLTLPSIRSKSSAAQFNDSPTLTLTDQADNAVEFTQDRLMKKGLQLGRDFEQEIAKYNAAANPASWSAAKVTAPAVAPKMLNEPANSVVTTAPVALAITDAQPEGVAPVVNNSAEQPSQAEVSNMLDYWYQKATPQTQAEFKARINQ
ncbi:UPF0319 protein [Shewanella algicola]|uniref:DUF2057 domain-containing protein n=1 Tax=Shewanella algicola TaxID=640633 RepID=A0A9X2CCW4_9GAMM|nr:DUF2057 domain-containing protein [Shewanella algicola]MCL1104831.1 DUF2057 domain-containing protein [Shewanella algicola]GGP57451.1 UPF0319 protein [Shewanella algicola]